MSSAGIYVAGATTALTRRTTMRKAFLAPWHRAVEACWLYSLADAQRHTGVAVHHSVLVVNHHHTTVTPSRDNLPEFMRRFHRDLSCSLHTLLCIERYDAPHELFDDRQTHRMRLVDAAAQASHLVYERLNPVAAGLVARPEHMPLRSLDFALWKKGYIEVERPDFYFEDRPKWLRLELTPSPLLYRAFGGDLERLVYQLERITERGLRSIRAARTREPMGARALRRLHPWSESKTLRESTSERVATFKVGAQNLLGRAQRIHGALETTRFRKAHCEARIARHQGDVEARYPFGTYAARVYYGAPVEPMPPFDALIAQPGPLLEDIKAELAAQPPESDAARDASHAIVAEVEGAFADEASDVVEAIDLEMVSASASFTADAATPSESDPAREPMVVRHRFEPGHPNQRAARVVTLRDRRRGKSRRGAANHGSDPPR